MSTKCTWTTLFFMVVLLSSHMGWAQGSSQELSQQAMDQCQKGRIAADRYARLGHFDRGIQLAEEALKLDDRNPNAHFSLFCNLGEKMRVDGESLAAVMDYSRLMEALDTALMLDPDFLDALSAKGMLLVRLPWIMGGDSEKGEVMLKRVVKEDPTAVNARMGLARVCVDRGDHQTALVYAQDAYELAKQKKQLDLLPEAQELLANIQGITVSR